MSVRVATESSHIEESGQFAKKDSTESSRKEFSEIVFSKEIDFEWEFQINFARQRGLVCSEDTRECFHMDASKPVPAPHDLP